MSIQRMIHPLEQLNWAGQLADVKEYQYQQSVLLDTVLELLIEKGVITREEIAHKARSLDQSHRTGEPPGTLA